MAQAAVYHVSPTISIAQNKILKYLQYFLSMPQFLSDLPKCDFPNVQNNIGPQEGIYQMCTATPWIYQM
jgi:hypothetical protein